MLTKTTGAYFMSSSITPLDREAQLSVENDLFGSVVGAMPVQGFLDKFLPTSREPVAEVESNFFESIPTSGNEIDRYQYFVSPRLPQR